ncbi:hypothetical protein HDU87_006233 [Geranomyces variabilis]|uniref:Uncharacterized protein n=1 Tax=Geranomyces variabilis TaxID=109894 RepID=A0AAD5XKL5_9FUNG|nr:hypothetical protein HDU87_006233 [Geranomyces variabilis]
MAHFDFDDDIPLASGGGGGPSSGPPGSPSSSGLPTSYYERYTRNYNLGERQRQLEQEEEQKRRAREASRDRSYGRRPGGAGGGVGGAAANTTGSSSVATSDHLESAVENLYKMVERKVSSDHPEPSRYPTTSSSAARAHSTRSRPESWTSTAIHSEVSKLYHMGAATAPHDPMPGAHERAAAYERTVGGGNGGAASTVSTFWRNGRAVALEDHDPEKRRSGGSDKGISCDLLLLIYGFIFPPLWWVGAFRDEPTAYRKWCRILAVVGTLLYLGAIAALVWFFVFRNS